MKYFIRHKIYEDGRVKEIKIPQKVVMKQIDELLRRDKEMLEMAEEGMDDYQEQLKSLDI